MAEVLRPVVYLVTNLVNGHTYVGVTRFTAEHRWKQHVDRAAKSKSRFGAAIREHGASAFVLEGLATCFSIPDARETEKAIIRQRAPEYNQMAGGQITAGRKYSAETLAKMSASLKGRRQTQLQRERNRQHGLARMADPQRRAKAADHLSVVRSLVDETKRREAVGTAASGRVWSNESRAKLSASCMGRVYGSDVIQRMRLTKFKKVYCPELEVTYGCADEAAIQLNLNVANIYHVCHGKTKRTGGLTFTYHIPEETTSCS